ncbi:TonB-dependent receptor [Colwellia piezophila]|uniref:TonB-dependent receptor n=1 Tax=Colwellia piezophila TaxID=211668 RepID=UPI000376D400|nr:TonB-dependent receptor [Colwellia piezophila]
MKKFCISTLIPALIFAFSLTLPVVAQEDIFDLYNLSLKELMLVEIVTTSATRIAQHTEKAPSTVYTFSGDQLMLEGIRTLTEVLAKVPGIQIEPNRQGHPVVWIRGLQGRYNSRLLMRVDNAVVREMYFGNAMLDEMYPIDHIETIEILIGPSSVLYGANAFGGIIDIKTKQGINNVSISGGNFDSYSGSFHLNNENLSIFVKHSVTGDAFRPEQIGINGNDRRIAQDNVRESTYLDVKYAFHENLQLSVTKILHHYPITYSSAHSDSELELEPLTVNLNYETGDPKDIQFNLNSYYHESGFSQTTDTVTRTGPIQPDSHTVAHRDTRYAGLDTYITKLFDDHSVILGLNVLTHESDNSLEKVYDSEGVLTRSAERLINPDERFVDYGLYLQDVWALPSAWEVTTGIRFDKPDGFDKQFDVRLGVVKSFDQGLYIKGIFGTAYRQPTYREYRKESGGVAIFDPSLQPEQLSTYELAIGKRYADRGSILLTGFYNGYTDYIADVFDPALGDEVFSNVGNRTIYGLELSGDWWLVEGQWNIRSGLTLLDAKDHELDTKLHALSTEFGYAELTYLPKENIHIGLKGSYYSRPFVDSNYQSRVPDENKDPSLNDSYFVLSGHITYRPTTKIDVVLSGTNLLNHTDYSPNFGPSSGYDYEKQGIQVNLALSYKY